MATELDANLQAIEQDAQSLCARIFSYCENHVSSSQPVPPTRQALEQAAIGVRSATKVFVILAHECVCKKVDGGSGHEAEASEE